MIYNTKCVRNGGFMDITRFMLSNVPMFAGFSAEQIAGLIEGSDVCTYEVNEAVIEFGEHGRFLGILIDGEAEVSVTDDSGKKHVIDYLKSGDIFGEISLMTGNNTIADIIGKTRIKALIIPQILFSTFLASQPRAIKYVSGLIAERLDKYVRSETDWMSSDELLMQRADPFGLGLKSAKPVTILVIDCGSRAIEYSLFDTGKIDIDIHGTIDRIGAEEAKNEFFDGIKDMITQLPNISHKEAFDAIAGSISSLPKDFIDSPASISLVGHRVAHGGDKFLSPTLINEDVLKSIELLTELSTLDIPANVTGIREAMRIIPDAIHVAVFETSFHRTLPPYAYLYGLPFGYYETDKIRRYGFHGISHSYVSLKAAEYLSQPYNSIEIVTCCLGNDASVCAIDHGRSVDTSMGFSPLEGLVMATRCGNVDPGALIHIMRTRQLSPDELDRILSESSGVLGISGFSSDMKEVEAKASDGNHQAILAVKTFAYQVRKYIGAYAAAMAGLDVVVFSGGIGEGSVVVRSFACQGLSIFGIVLDEKKNREVKSDGRVHEISAINSRVKVLVIPADDKRMIAREALGVFNTEHISGIITGKKPLSIPVEVSAHHVHLSVEHIDALFGKGYALTILHELSQPGQYACNETVNLVGPKGRIDRVRILGPARAKTQVEIAMTEQFKLGLQSPIRESGDLKGSPGITIEGPEGSIQIDEGVICALRHIHMSPEEALAFALRDKDFVRVRLEGDRELIFGDVLIRVNHNFRLAMHIDTDEGNAADITSGTKGFIDGIQSRG
jgi:acetate kinase